MSTPKAMKDFIQRRKDNNLCILCGNPLDRDGVRCTNCNNTQNKEGKSTRQTYIQCGICPRCRKNPIMGVEKMCPECRAKQYEWRNNRSEEKKKIAEEQSRISHENKRQYCRENGICYNCKKRESLPNKKLCSICREKLNRKNREYYERNKIGLTKEEKIEKGICIWCDNPVKDGKKICEAHYEKCIKNLEKGRKPNEEWRRLNDVQIFKRKKKK